MSNLVEEAGTLLLSKDTGEALRSLRQKHKASSNQLANFLDISRSVISDYENGRRPNPGVTLLNKFLLGIHSISEKEWGSTESDNSNFL